MARIGLAPCSFARLTHGVSHCLFQKTFCIHHALNLQAGASNSFLAKDCICYYLPHPPGKMLQIPSLTAGNMEIWLCKHIKGILTKRGSGVHTLAFLVIAHWARSSSTRGCAVEAKTWFWTPKPHSAAPHQAGLPPLGLIHICQACGLLIAFTLFNQPPPPALPPPHPCP